MLEIVICLAIISVLAGIGVPNLNQQLPKYRLNGAARRVSWDLIAARFDAIRQKHTVKVTFLNSQEYKIWIDKNNNNSEDTGEVTIRNIQSRYKGVQINSSKHPTFSATGTVTDPPNSDVPIVLSSATGSKYITMSAIGLVKIE